jgi:hypothetical protein
MNNQSLLRVHRGRAQATVPGKAVVAIESRLLRLFFNWDEFDVPVEFITYVQANQIYQRRQGWSPGQEALQLGAP